MNTSETKDFMEFLRSEDGGNCTEIKIIADGVYAAIKPLIFHWTLIVGQVGDEFSYSDRWCCADQDKASKALQEWDGIGEPQGWHRHPASGRRRADGNPEMEHFAP